MNKFLSILVAVVAGVVVGIRVEKLIPEQHAVLEVVLTIRATDDMKDEVLLKNALEKGGKITLAVDGDYADFLYKLDPAFEQTAASTKEGKYLIKPAILNWVAARGWKLLAVDNANMIYTFVK